MDEHIGDLHVGLSLDDARYYADLKAMEAETISTMDAIDRQKAIIPVRIDERNLRHELRKISREMAAWKREFSGDDDKSGLKAILDELAARREIIQSQLDEAELHRQNLGYINQAKTLDERRAREAEVEERRKAAEAEKAAEKERIRRRREQREKEQDEDRAAKRRRDEEIHAERMTRERAKTQREIERSTKEEAKTLKEISDLKPEEIAAARRRAADEFDRMAADENGSFRRYKDEHASEIEDFQIARDIADYYEAENEWIAHKRMEAEDKAQEELERHRDANAHKSANREHKRRGWWYRVTAGGSNTPMETFRKLLKEPVRMGPFSVSMRGVLAAMTTLNPILRMVIGSLSSMIGSLGAATLAFGALGLAAAGGFAQIGAGLFMVMRPMVNEFKMASQATDAYAKAVAKYGATSDQAKTKHEQMNNVIKSMSPTARAAYRDLAIVQTTFERMTMKARPYLDGLLRSGMNAFRQAAPGFSKNTVRATGIISTELSTIFDRINSSRNRGNDPLNTMFVNANKALGPLIRGMGYLGEALAHIGASASRFLAPLSLGFARAMDKFLDKTEKTKSLDGTINRLMVDLVSVGRLLGSSTRLLKNFFNAGRPTGQGLFDSLTKTFNNWNKKITSETGKAKLRLFFEQAAVTARRFGETIVAIGQAFGIFSKLTAPLAAGVAGLVDAFNSIVGAIAGTAAGLRIIQALITGLVAGMITFKVVTALTSGAFGRFMGTLIMDLRTGGSAFAAFGATAASSTAMATMGLSLIVGLLATVAAGFLMGGDHVDEMRKKIDDAKDSSDALAASLADTMSGQGMLKLDLRDQKAALKNMTKGTPEYERQLRTIADTQRRINQGEQEITGKIRNRMNARTEEVGKAKQAYTTAKAQVEEVKNDAKFRAQSAEEQKNQLDALEESLKLDEKRTTYTVAQNKALGDRFELMRAQANQADLPQGKAGENIRQLLGELGSISKAGYNIAAKIAVTAPTADDLRLEADAAKKALQAGLSGGAVMKIIADGKNAKAIIDKLTKTTTKYIELKAVDQVTPVIDNLKSSLTAAFRVVGASAEGYMPAASGYTKTTAAGRARRRPMRRAMGKFNEPTFLVGEENRSEYVIATNPAYRRQNQMYLAQAASEIGMYAEPAARGRTPNSSILLADALLDSKTILSKMKQDRRRAKALEKKIKKYNRLAKKPKSGSSAYISHQDDVAELRAIKQDLRRNTNKKLPGVIGGISYQRNLIDEATNEMTLAEKSGNGARYEAARKRKEAALLALDQMYLKAERGQRGGRLSKLRAERYQIESDLADTRTSSIGGIAGAIGQAQIDQLTSQLTSARNEAVINSMFGSTAGGLNDIIASGGPRRSGRGDGAPVIHINTLVPSDQRTLDTINDVVVGAMSTQGNRIAAGMTVG